MVSSFPNVHIICLIVCVLLSPSLADISTTPENALLIVSFDAFRPEYFQRNITPFINELRNSGVKTDFMRNVFPTKTFTNHFSIATGLYPANHGVVSNELYDLKLKKSLKYGYELFHYNENVLPIWVRSHLARLTQRQTICKWDAIELAKPYKL